MGAPVDVLTALTMNDREPVLEYACHEGNYALRNMLSGERAMEREAGGRIGAGYRAGVSTR